MHVRPTLLLLGGVALMSCGSGGGEVPAVACDEPRVHELGVPVGDRAAFFRTTAGELRFSVADLAKDTALGDVRSTAIAVGPGDAGPTIDPQSPGVVPGSVVRETVRPDEPMTTELTEGDYWVVSSNGGSVTLSVCADVEITDVRPATAQNGDAFTPADD
jgi:hypothetical protein